MNKFRFICKLKILIGDYYESNKNRKIYCGYEKKTKSFTETNIINLVGELNKITNNNESKNIGTAIGILFVGFLSLFTTSLGSIGLQNLLSLPIMFYLLGLVFLIISISVWFHDFRNALKFCFNKNQITEKEVNASIQAIKFASFLTLAIG